MLVNALMIAQMALTPVLESVPLANQIAGYVELIRLAQFAKLDSI